MAIPPWSRHRPGQCRTPVGRTGETDVVDADAESPVFAACRASEYWPNRNAGTPFQTCDEVGTVMAPLNVPHPDNVLGVGWVVPTMAQLAALLSNDCVADPLNPSSFVTGQNKCNSPLGKNTSNPVRDYLADLNPTDDRSAGGLLRPQEGGGLPREEPRLDERFRDPGDALWAAGLPDLRLYPALLPNPHRVLPDCDQRQRPRGRRSSPAWHDRGTNVPGLPRLPDKFPGYDGFIATDIAHQNCDKFMVEMYRAGPSTSAFRRRCERAP